MSDTTHDNSSSIVMFPSLKGGSDAPLVWHPTPALRFIERLTVAQPIGGGRVVERILQQSWFGTNGVRAEQEWRDVPTESEAS